MATIVSTLRNMRGGIGGSLLLGAAMLSPASARAAPRCDLKAPNAAEAGAGCAKAWMDRNLKLNDLMAVGTHNSYKHAIPPRDYALIAAKYPQIWKVDYAHKSLTAQLDKGARQLEIDVVYDPKGGRFIEVWEGDMLAKMFSDVRNPFAHGPGQSPMPTLSPEQTNWTIETAMTWIKSLVRRF
ncbi:Ca2+-dependent phosphoinositide-specific phospholipase C [Stakelama saccharophila]|uniref:Ca2+-dependent phosphoinositide-specific phospholipase C n=1 Tax=Stakelama saccharophila TaxID=3075605 RepID=A0ABZ0B9H2_9SPHN|nr:Ca2+-dependent phosphoinositide-specific phospholipase C [Stakelama sp. W311]WNO53867.1 Ca2+-dependent phosphoinositide-specific phospholipase C [Stakelama sp. W311]